MPRYLVQQTEFYYIDADDPQAAIDDLDNMDNDDTAAAYDTRKVIVFDVETGQDYEVDV